MCAYKCQNIISRQKREKCRACCRHFAHCHKRNSSSVTSVTNFCKFITCCKTSKCENIILELIHSCESSVSTTQRMKPWIEFLYLLKHVELFQSVFDSDSIEHSGKQQKKKEKKKGEALSKSTGLLGHPNLCIFTLWFDSWYGKKWLCNFTVQCVFIRSTSY